MGEVAAKARTEAAAMQRVVGWVWCGVSVKVKTRGVQEAEVPNKEHEPLVVAADRQLWVEWVPLAGMLGGLWLCG